MSSQTDNTSQQRTNKRITGVVVSDRMQNTIIVEQERLVKHPRYGKYVKRRTRIYADNPNNEARLHDTVVVQRCRPISKLKSWRLVSRARIADTGPEAAADAGVASLKAAAPAKPSAPPQAPVDSAPAE